VYHFVTAFSTWICLSELVDNVVEVMMLIGEILMQFYSKYVTRTIRERRYNLVLFCFGLPASIPACWNPNSKPW
jgi:hypothetical protein